MADRVRKLLLFIQKQPHDPFPRFALALELLKSGKLETSRRLFESVLALDEHYPGLAYHLGKLYHQMGDIGLSRSLIQKGIRKAEEDKDDHTRQELAAALLELESDESLPD
jgi:tetratricopeptide (TPR) repeat protein